MVATDCEELLERFVVMESLGRTTWVEQLGLVFWKCEVQKFFENFELCCDVNSQNGKKEDANLDEFVIIECLKVYVNEKLYDTKWTARGSEKRAFY